nr:4'-phosphopantetheinyl transferase superfamily protein [Lentibacter algarum]
MPSEVVFACDDPQSPPEGLWPEEARSIANAIAKRQCEYAAGRRAARNALSRLGLPAEPLLAAANRVPIWPEGTVGSISHCTEKCIALVAFKNDVQSLGVDVESAGPLKSELVAEVCTPREVSTLINASATPLVRAKQVFSAKEAAFKAQYMITGKMLGFGGFEIAFPTSTQFLARFTRPENDFEEQFEGHGHALLFDDHFYHIVLIA